MKNREEQRFTDQFLSLNPKIENSFQTWLLCPEMTFKSTGKWWGDRGNRQTKHEGIDLGYFMDSAGSVQKVDDELLFPALYDARLLFRFRDYLGETLVFQHLDEDSPNGSAGCFIFGHAQPIPKLKSEVEAGQPVATLSLMSRIDIQPHLHISIGEVRKDKLKLLDSWVNIADKNIIELKDPLSIIDRYRVVEISTLLPL